MKIMSEETILDLLISNDPDVLNELLTAADNCRRDKLNNKVYLRGLIEFSNYCNCNCLYCGIRKNNRQLTRFHLGKEEIVNLALQAVENGYQSICLQSGEICTDRQTDFIADLVGTIKVKSSKNGSAGLGITLSVGELSYQQYNKLWEAGAHRYLLRIESSNPRLFKRIHPPSQTFEKRLECLSSLKDIGYQVGTGVMIGLPQQTYEDLLMDLSFFVEKDIDMLGMGPYIPCPGTPLAKVEESRNHWNPYLLSVKMIALARLNMPDINIVASTALQTINPNGLKIGLRAGANIVMPVMTPADCRQDYSLYENKKFSDFEELRQEISTSGYEIALGQWGDAPHYYKRQGLPYPGS